MKTENRTITCIIFLLTGTSILFTFFTLWMLKFNFTTTEHPILQYTPTLSIILIITGLAGLTCNNDYPEHKNSNNKQN